MRRSFSERIGKEWLYFDGGTGSLLQKKGLMPGELPETWNLTHPEAVEEIACGYFLAGSDVVNTNTFGANALKYPENVEEIVRAGVELAQSARRKSGREDAYIALDLGPTGKLLQPLGDLSFDRAVELYAQVVRAGAEAGADLVLIETMGDTYEAKAAVLAAKENCRLPVCITFAFDGKGKLLTGGDIDTVTAMFEGLGVTAIGMNCGLGPRQMLPFAHRMAEISSIPVIVNPNAGLPRSENGATVYDVGPEEYASAMREIAELGIHGMGGCCGTTPEHIRAMIAACREIPFRPPTEKRRTVVTSFSGAVEIGSVPVIIGERINPTGKKRFQQALREGDLDYVLSQAIEQEDSGARILDVNVGLPDIDEPAMMRKVVTKLQEITALPLQIDTADPEALEQGLRYYNGKAMVNSVNGKEESLQALLPIVKKYGGVLVGLTLDESGIPASAEGRLAVAEKICRRAEQAGIPRKELVIDGLAMSVSSDSRSALVTLETVGRITREMGLHTILGVSNISFGLPYREAVNAAFFTMAMREGLSCAIVNPNNAAMMQAYRCFLALSDMDPNFQGYIGAFADAEPKPEGPKTVRKKETAGPAAGPKTLSDSVIRGMAGRAAEMTEELLASREPMELINEELIPALDVVGKGFEAGTTFLPQLLMSAEAAQAAFSVIRERMSGKPQQTKGRVIVATVKNDIHDIGKNIARVMLENYGYDVIDLGKDVPPEVIVDCAVKNDIRLVGLSALMTTTVVSMEETIRLLKEKKPETKVLVSGAVMTQEYADRIHADVYVKDAMGTVRYADRIFGGEN